MEKSIRSAITDKFDVTAYRLPVFDRRQREFVETLGSISSRDFHHELNMIVSAIVEDLIRWTVQMRFVTESIADSRLVLRLIPDKIFREVFRKLKFQFPNLVDRCDVILKEKKFLVSIF